MKQLHFRFTACQWSCKHCKFAKLLKGEPREPSFSPAISHYVLHHQNINMKCEGYPVARMNNGAFPLQLFCVSTGSCTWYPLNFSYLRWQGSSRAQLMLNITWTDCWPLISLRGPTNVLENQLCMSGQLWMQFSYFLSNKIFQAMNLNYCASLHYAITEGWSGARG